jgi:hypothetical protein
MITAAAVMLFSFVIVVLIVPAASVLFPVTLARGWRKLSHSRRLIEERREG